MSTFILADKRPYTSKGDVTFYLDYAGFKANNGNVYCEFYLSSFTDQFKQKITDSNIIAEIKLFTKIEDYFGNTFYHNSWPTNVALPKNNNNSKNLIFYDQWQVELSPGDYNI
ncbi:MAG: hypothetical protein KDC88_11960 [Ignavibacteriae bacterium]|nr:hypothetical protein [Ignavibacteriota bacterium]